MFFVLSNPSKEGEIYVIMTGEDTYHNDIPFPLKIINSKEEKQLRVAFLPYEDTAPSERRSAPHLTLCPPCRFIVGVAASFFRMFHIGGGVC